MRSSSMLDQTMKKSTYSTCVTLMAMKQVLLSSKKLALGLSCFLEIECSVPNFWYAANILPEYLSILSSLFLVSHNCKQQQQLPCNNRKNNNWNCLPSNHNLKCKGFWAKYCLYFSYKSF